MTNVKSDRLGLRGRLAHYEFALRLLGGANATGAIAAGVAFHAFAQNADVQSSLKLATVFFLFGIFTFGIAYMGWFLTVLQIDNFLRKESAPWPEYLGLPANTAEESQSSAKRTFIVTTFLGLASFVFFFFGLTWVLMMAIRLQLGSN